MRYALAFLLLVLISTPALGHSWYDHECCHDKDCAEVTKIEKSGDTTFMKTKFGTFPVGPDSDHKIKKSQDEKIHLCAVPDMYAPNRYKIRCIYYPTMY